MRIHATVLLFVLGSAASGGCQDLGKGLKDRIDAIVAAAYQAAASGLPGNIKSSGRPRMLRWQETDRCLNRAAGNVDWEAMSEQLQALRGELKAVQTGDLVASVEASLAAHALPFEKVFRVNTENALLPLTHSLLKFLPEDSLHDLPVFERSGKQIGLFAGVYWYERTGGLATANIYRMAMFQYVDANGNIQAAQRGFEQDAFGVQWNSVRSQPGFRLTAEKLDLGP